MNNKNKRLKGYIKYCVYKVGVFTTFIKNLITKALTIWVSKQSLEHLENIREYEIRIVLDSLPKGSNILEIGAGTGWQSKIFAENGFNVSAIDLAESVYKSERVWNILDYDGRIIPFPENSFDLVFSSNVLEHVKNVVIFQQEILRVIKPGGYAIHVLPSSTWRIWTNITHILKCYTLPYAHGVHSKNAFDEMFNFSKRYWKKIFSNTGWTIEGITTTRLFYTGHFIFDKKSLSKRVII